MMICFAQLAISILHRIDQRGLPIIDLQGLIDEIKNTLCTSQGIENRIKLLGNAGNRLGKIARILQDVYKRQEFRHSALRPRPDGTDNGKN